MPAAVFALASHSTAELEDLVTRADAAVFLTVDAFGGTDFRARADHLAAVRASTSCAGRARSASYSTITPMLGLPP